MKNLGEKVVFWLDKHPKSDRWIGFVLFTSLGMAAAIPGVALLGISIFSLFR